MIKELKKLREESKMNVNAGYMGELLLKIDTEIEQIPTAIVDVSGDKLISCYNVRKILAEYNCVCLHKDYNERIELVIDNQLCECKYCPFCGRKLV